MLVGVVQGVDLWGERSREVEDSLLDWADCILVWSASDLEALRRQPHVPQDKLRPLDPDGLLLPWTTNCDEADLRARLPAIEQLSRRCVQRLGGTNIPLYG